MKRPWQIWRDRRGRLSPLRIATLALLILPVGIAVHAYATAGFGARPLNDMIHRAGYWALIFVMLSLAVTPLRRIARCHPWGTDGLDFVPRQRPSAARWYLPWRYGRWRGTQIEP